MRRRDLVTLIGAAALAYPLAARTQQTAGRRRVGVSMSTAEKEPHEQAAVRAFASALTQLGWEVGQISTSSIAGERDTAQMQANAHELVALAPDTILAKGGTMPALRDATATIPIVFVVTGDDAALSYAGEFAHPRRNMTGFTTPESELVGKRLELLREIAQILERPVSCESRGWRGRQPGAVFARRRLCEASGHRSRRRSR